MVLNLRQFSLRFLVICTSRYEYVKEYYIKWGKFSLFTYFTHSAYFSSYISSCNKTLYARVVSQYHCYQINHYLLTYLLPYSMEQIRPWEPNQFSASQEIPRILWKLKFYYCIHKCPPSLPILSQLHIVYTPTSHFLKIHLNIILPSTPGSTKWTLCLRFPHQNPVYASPVTHTRYMPRSSHCSRFYRPKSIWSGVQIIKLLIM